MYISLALTANKIGSCSLPPCVELHTSSQIRKESLSKLMKWPAVDFPVEIEESLGVRRIVLLSVLSATSTPCLGYLRCSVHADSFNCMYCNYYSYCISIQMSQSNRTFE